MANFKRWDGLFFVLDANKSGDISLADVDHGVKRFAEWSKIKPDSPEYKDLVGAYTTLYLYLKNNTDNDKEFILTQESVGNFIKLVDTNNDGVVTKSEYDVAVKKLVDGGKAGIPAWWKTAGDLLFSAIDSNKNGELSLDELKTYAQNINPSTKDEDVKSAFEWAKATIGKPKIDADGLMDLVWVWGSDPEPRPELDIIFAYWVAY